MRTRRGKRSDRTKGTEEKKRHKSAGAALRAIKMLFDVLEDIEKKAGAGPPPETSRFAPVVSIGPQSSFSVTFLKVFPASRVTSAVACPFFNSGTMLTARDPGLALTAVSAAASNGTFAFAMAAFCDVAALRSSASVI